MHMNYIHVNMNIVLYVAMCIHVQVYTVQCILYIVITCTVFSNRPSISFRYALKNHAARFKHDAMAFQVPYDLHKQ